MSSKWQDDEITQLVIDRLIAASKLDKNGEVVFQGQNIFEDFSLLTSLTNFNKEIPYDQQTQIIRDSLKISIKKKLTNQVDIGNEIKKGEQKYLKKPKKPFILLTSISIKPNLKLSCVRFDKTTITFSKYQPTKYKTSFIEDRVPSLKVSIPQNYYKVKVRVVSRCPSAATDSAFDALDLLRGLWNLFYNLRGWRRVSDGRPNAVNKIVLGPIHTLHEVSGKPATNIFWWEPSYVDNNLFAMDHNKYSKMKVFEKDIRRIIKKTKLSVFLNEAIRRYVRALDEPNMSSSFLKLWSVLEYLTVTSGKNFSHENTINRTAYIFVDYKYHRALLDSMRKIRNVLVHTGSDSKGMEGNVFQLKYYVEKLLWFSIGNIHKFKNENEFGTFIGATPNLNDVIFKEKKLKRELELVGFAKELLES